MAGPGLPDAPSMDARARSIFAYFKKYNYTVTETGEVINFQGMYKASTAQAAALVFYVFCGACLCGIAGAAQQSTQADGRQAEGMQDPALIDQRAQQAAARHVCCKPSVHAGNPACLAQRACFQAEASQQRGRSLHHCSAGMASLALVLSVALPFGGGYWYALVALSPLAGAYYWSKGTRKEDFKVRCLQW